MGKARRRAAAGDGASSASGGGGGGGGGSGGCGEEHKLYLEEAVLERRHSDVDLRQLVDLPPGLGYNEWLASHTVDFFQHVNLVYGTISEFCTSSTCPDMNGPCQRQYTWTDEKGKKIKTTAPQYIDYVMTFTQKSVCNEALFPSRLANDFPHEFEAMVRRVFVLLFHVLAHVYHNHFRELMLLTLHAHLNCIFAHFSLFNERFKLISDRETYVLHDLAVALKLSPSASTVSPPEGVYVDEDKSHGVSAHGHSSSTAAGAEESSALAAANTSALCAVSAATATDAQPTLPTSSGQQANH